MLGKIRILFWITYGVWLAAFVVLPILLVLYQSLHDVHGRWTLENFFRFFSPVYLRMAGDSLWYAFWITFLSLVVAYPAALALVRLASRDFWLVALILPSWVNLLLKAYAFLGILSEHGPVNALVSLVGLGPVPLLFTDLGFVLVSVYIFIPFMILPIFNAVRAIPAELIDAARDLGASPLQVVRRVIWPLSLPGVRAGVQATFIPALSLFMITRLIAGNRVITLGTAIEQHFLVTGDWGMGSAIAVVLLLLMSASVIFARRSFFAAPVGGE
ncbi:ABC transporter permease [Brockia lithotrophica]|uniref:ABC-type spermidine/putrescine transport system permease subunit I n=1 Tax=Brockia lithotrophica TaxID=933949 RepID=A0A660KYS9_9BACL|nr:ABC transporter permease [Brockia lithotrophica]RKQ85514.1 ABC-type spermidine/putrescine transport system permease subunit I [Brockia lithotrophica]